MGVRVHPWWYYLFYDYIFAVCRSHLSEVSVIDGVVSIAGKSVLEIGSGTGHHADAVLRLDPCTLVLVDYDPLACKVLRQRFKKYGNVTIRLGDGFRQGDGQFDIVLCMYSVLQQVDEQVSIGQRISSMRSSCQEGGTFIFEYINTDVSRQVYPSNVKSVVYESGSDFVCLSSAYGMARTRLRYWGKLAGRPVAYSVSLENMNHEMCVRLVEQNGGHVCMMIPLDGDVHRRMLCVAQPK